MKKLSMATIISVLISLFIFIIASALVSNSNFETGDFTGWTKSAFINNGFNTTHGVGGTDLSVLVGGPAVAPLSLSDPNTGNILQYPAYGHYSARINSELSYTGGAFPQNANIITQNIIAVLNPQDNLAHIRFTYAAVMVNPVTSPHTAEEKPYFRVQAINTDNNNDILYDFSSYVNEPGKNWQDGPVFSGSDTWKYLDWNYIDLTSSEAHPVHAGDNIIIEITAAGCSLGGHPGYVYLDEVTDGDIAGPSINASGPANIITNNTITYTYNYLNGSASTINSTITAVQPVGVTFTSVSDATNCSLSSGTVTCNYAGVSAGAGGSFTIDGTVTATSGSQIAHGNYSIAATGFPTLSGQTVLTDVISSIETYITGTLKGSYFLASGESARVNYTSVDSGPMKVLSADGSQLLVAAIRDAWAVNGVTTSFTQLMGLPLSQVSDQYVFPGYNNVTLNEQLRIGNVDTVPSTVTVTIGGILRGTYTLQPNEAMRVNYPGVDSGPVIIQGTTGVDIVASIRSAWAVNGVTTSFAQLMGTPASQLTNKYVFPVYNNVTLNDQMRIGNVDTVPSTVTVTIAGVLKGTYTLQPSEAVRVNYAGVDSGPVVVEGTSGVKIVSSIREAWSTNGVTTSFTQLMGQPATQLSNKYLFPSYNNVTLNEQLRIANVDTVSSTVNVTIGGILRGTHTLLPGEVVRVNYAGVDSGPVVVEGTSGVDIVASIRDAWAVNGVTHSFSQLMGLPSGQVSTTYFFPSYNNITVNEQLRFSVP